MAVLRIAKQLPGEPGEQRRASKLADHPQSGDTKIAEQWAATLHQDAREGCGEASVGPDKEAIAQQGEEQVKRKGEGEVGRHCKVDPVRDAGTEQHAIQEAGEKSATWCFSTNNEE